MRFRISVLALLAVAALHRGGCEGERLGYDPCADKACGEACTVCDPADPNCVETAVVKTCDPFGRCVPGTVACSPLDACKGKACGDECEITLPCHYATPPCLAPVLLGHCDAALQCVGGEPPLCGPDPCAGKKCGDACDPCGGLCMHPYATVCDATGRCVIAAPGLCP